MGHSAAGLARLRKMAAGFRDASACILIPTTTKDARLKDVLTGYSATIGAGRFRKKTRTPTIKDGAGRTLEVSDWDVQIDWLTIHVPSNAFILQGVLVWKGTRDDATAYIVGDGVVEAGAFYDCIQANTGQPVSDATSWRSASSFSVIGNNIASGNRVKTLIDLKQINP